MDEIKRIESLVPTQSRVSLVDLARLIKLWEDSGMQVRSLSELIRWAIGTLCDELEKSGEIKPMSVVEADKVLRERGLYQRSMKNRAGPRIATAIRFESLRKRGLNPAVEDPAGFNNLHSGYSATPERDKVKVKAEDVEFAMQRIKELKMQTEKE